MKRVFTLFALMLGFIACTTVPGGNDKYLVDEFADLKVIRYEIPNWDMLTLQQKEYIYYLSEAAKCGRDILWLQNFKYNLVIRKTLETIIENYSGDRETDDYQRFLVYAKRVFFSNGIHHHYAEDKILPDLPQDYIKELIINSNKDLLPITENQSLEEFTEWISDIICNPNLYKMRRSNDQSKDLLIESASGLYEGGVTTEEANRFYEGMENPNDTTPIAHGLNSILGKKDGKLFEEAYRVGGLYGKALEQIVYWLAKARTVAENDAQKHYIQLLIDYYQTGDLKLWDDYNISWVQDSMSAVDFVNGFVEVYADPLGRKATWEALVNFKDFEASKMSQIICDNAQWFENNAPVDSRFRKEKVKGVSAKVIIATTLGGDTYPVPPIGINLPNSPWIRKDFGSVSVTIVNISDAHDRAAQESPGNALQEFAFSQEEIDLSMKYGRLSGILHTTLHECLGHGSGQLLPSTLPNALKEYHSTLEEARADLFALYYMFDEKMIELGLFENLDVAKAAYMSYIRNGLFTQFTRIELGKDLTQAHMQCRKLIADWCYEHGQAENVIEKVVKDGKTYFKINDFGKLRTLFGVLLAEIQRIKSEGDYDAGKNLVETYAIKIDPELHKEVKERYEKLNLKPYTGFINPNIIAVEKDGKIVDVKVEYPTDFLQQQLDYGKKYRFLK